jgi:hypothetical protein
MLLARPADETLLRSGDKVPFGAVDGAVGSDGDGGEEGKYLEEGKDAVGEKEDAVVPDDLAEEGMLRFPVGKHMHAGFGGPWRGRLKRG